MTGAFQARAKPFDLCILAVRVAIGFPKCVAKGSCFLGRGLGGDILFAALYDLLQNVTF